MRALLKVIAPAQRANGVDRRRAVAAFIFAMATAGCDRRRSGPLARAHAPCVFLHLSSREHQGRMCVGTTRPGATATAMSRMNFAGGGRRLQRLLADLASIHVKRSRGPSIFSRVGSEEFFDPRYCARSIVFIKDSGSALTRNYSLGYPRLLL